MVLRAMGYDANNEFTGPNWIVNVSSIATQRGLLKDVKSTHYGNTLHLASRRDVVASILFQAAQADRVKYTPAFGYQTGDHTTGSPITNHYNEYTPLGVLNFGLAKETSIVLGNQATGEKYTLLSAKTVPYTVVVAGNDTTAYCDNPYEYAYPGTQIPNGSLPANAKAGSTSTVPAGLKLAGDYGKTNLDLFGHKVKAWYDARSSSTNKDGAQPTYAILDKATLAATVKSPLTATDGTATNKNEKLSDSNKNDALLGIEAQKAGFSVNLDGANASEAHTSNAFARIDRNTSATAAAATVPARTDNTQVAPGYGMYVLISNNDNKTVDVMITLNVQVARITYKDTISTTKTLTLNGSNYDAQKTNNGVIPMDSITEGSETTLGARVAAWQVNGTANNKTGFYDGNSIYTGNKGTNSNMPYYALEKLSETTTGTVSTYNGDGTITFTDGRKVERSWMYAQIKGNCYTDPVKAGDQFLAGVTYKLALDNQGRWLGVSTDPGEFIYATFGDYEVGALGTGTIRYAVTGVNWDGEKVINQTVNSITIPEKTAADFEFTYSPWAANHLVTYPTAGSTTLTLAAGYNKLPITMKDQGNANAGNRIKEGKNTAFLLDGNGALTISSLNGGLDDGTKWMNDDATFGNSVSVSKQDAANGFKSVNANAGTYGQLLLTSNTKFIVVSGSGSSDLNAKVYNGLTEFLNGAQSVTLKLVDGKDYVYYKTDADKFNTTNTTRNEMITHIIMSEDDLTYTGASDLYFHSAANADLKDPTGVKLAGAADDNTKGIYVEQFVLYKDGEPGTYFVRVGGDGSATEPTVNGDLYNPKKDSYDYFYRLVKVDEINGTPIYEVSSATRDYGKAADGGIWMADLKYNYIGVNNLSTALFTFAAQASTGAANPYAAAWQGQVMEVANAKVVDVEYDAVNCNHEKIDSLAKLNAAVSGNNAYDVTVSIVNDGVNVSVIYVTRVTP